jgi:hypothetical protein
MTATLHLGVVDVPYAVKDGTTTGQVARWLEDRYHVMEIFSEIHGQEIADAMAQSMADAVDGLMMGAPVSGNPLAAAESVIDVAFKKFIDTKEMDHLGIPGVPTKAAKDGVSKRFKSGFGPKNRPSFQDSGLYETDFKAWVD